MNLVHAIINPIAILAANLVRLPTVVSLLRIILSMLGQMLPADHRCGWTLRSATMRIGVAMHSFHFEAYSNIPMMARCFTIHLGNSIACTTPAQFVPTSLRGEPAQIP